MKSNIQNMTQDMEDVIIRYKDMVYRIALLRVKNTWKKKVNVKENMEDIAEKPYEFERDEENRLFSAMRKLPEKHQIVLELYYFEELSTKEIASLLNIRETAVRMRLSRAREGLRKQMEITHQENMGIWYSEGVQWDDMISRIYCIDDGKQGCYIVTYQNTIEEEEGYGSRFKTMLNTFQIIEKNTNSLKRQAGSFTCTGVSINNMRGLGFYIFLHHINP